jgi:hypothetical protein
MFTDVNLTGSMTGAELGEDCRFALPADQGSLSNWPKPERHSSEIRLGMRRGLSVCGKSSPLISLLGRTD